jgi:glycosyltransferase involved in cell wall biosynthesis
MRVLFLARQPPVSLDNGSRIRTHALVSQLADAAAVHLLAFDTQPGSTLPRQSVDSVVRALPRLEAVTLVRPRVTSKRRMQIETLFGAGSYLFRQHRSAPMARALARVIDTFQPDLLHCDNLLLGEFARAVPPTVVTAIAPENVESHLMRRMAETTDSPLRRRLYAREGQLLKRWEDASLRNYDLCLAVSEDDAQHFAKLGANAVCIPNGVSPHPIPKPVVPLRDGEPMRLLFVGSGSYEPNRIGVAWFIDSVLPLLVSQMAVELTLVGSGWEEQNHAHCHIMGHVASLDAYYETHHAAIVPLRAGGGSRLKVAEAIAKGVPLVGTSVGLEGYPLDPGVHALVGDTPQDLATHLRWLCDALRGDSAAVDRQVAAAFGVIERFFWDEIGDRLITVYGEAIARKHGLPSDRLAQRRGGSGRETHDPQHISTA